MPHSHVNFTTARPPVCVYMCENVHVSHMRARVCLCVHNRMKGSILPGPRIAELVQRLSFGMLIPFYSAGIMCYSNPNPIWGLWRWHEDDVTAGTRRDTENHRPTQSHKPTVGQITADGTVE